jgi:hypothetical protein
MTSGFSLVLWSRLHLIINNKRFLTVMLCFILFNDIALHSITISLQVTLDFGKHRADVGAALNIAGAVIFTAQETFITLLYIYKTVRFLKSGYSVHIRRMIGMLVLVQIFVISLDALGMTLLFTRKLVLAAICEPFFYCIRLKLEIAVLNELQESVKQGRLPGLSLVSTSLLQRPVHRDQYHHSITRHYYLRTTASLSGRRMLKSHHLVLHKL